MAAQTLGYLAPHVPPEPLIEALENDIDAAVRLYAVDSLGMQGDTEVTTHVPFILIPERKTLHSPLYVDDPITLADIAPTIWEILGVDSVSEVSRQKLGDKHGESLIRYGKDYFHPRSRGETFPLRTKTDRSKDEEEQKAIEEQMRALGYLE